MYGGVYGPEITDIFQFVGPEVNLVIPNVGNTYGGNRIAIVGKDLGDEHEKAVIYVGGKGCTHVEREGKGRLSCITPPGSGSVGVTVSVGGEVTEASHQGNFTYEEPVIHAISPNSGPCHGGNMITINGNGLKGGENMTTVVEVDGQPCLSVSIVDAHNINCKVPPSKNGGTVPIVVRINTVTISSTYKYDHPLVETIEPEQIPNYGGSIITIRGRFFGDGNSKQDRDAVTAFVGGKQCEKTTLISEVEVECVTPPGLGVDAKGGVMVKYNNARGEEKMLATFRGPFIKRTIPSHIPRDQPMRVQFEGRFLGNKNRVTHVSIDNKECKDLQLVDDHLLSCVVQPGNSGFASIKVEVGKDSSTFNEVLRRENVKISVRQVWRAEMERPKLTNSTNTTELELTIPFWVKTNLTVRVLASGINPNTQMNISIAGKSCDHRPFGKQIVNERPNSDFDERFITCTWGPDEGPVGFGPSAVKASFKDQYGTTHSAKSTLSLITIRTPIFTMTPQSVAFYGGEEVVFHYKEVDEGITGATGVKIWIGTSECKNLKRDMNRLTCIAPKGPVGPARVVVERNGKKKAQVLMAHFDPPMVRKVRPGIGPVIGGNIIELEGRHYSGNTVSVKIGSKDCKYVNVTSSGSLECEAPESDMSNVRLPVVVTVNGVSSIVNGLYEYLGPNEKNIKPPMGPTYGGEKVQIFGSGFGNGKQNIAAFLGGNPCLSTTYVSDSQIECITPAGSAGLANVSIQINSRMFDLKGRFEYMQPRMYTIEPAVGPAYGGQEVAVTGLYAIPKPVVLREKMKIDIRIGGAPCLKPEISGKVGQQFWKCTTTKNFGPNQDVTLSINGHPGKNVSDNKYEFVAPKIESHSPKSGPFYGNWTVSLKGKFMGIAKVQDKIVVRIGKSFCRDVQVISEEEITCVTPYMKPQNNVPVMINLFDEYDSEVYSGVDFVVPSVKKSTPAVGATYGGDVVEFAGVGLGSKNLHAKNGIEIVVGGNPCEKLEFVSDDGYTSKVKCTLPAAEGDQLMEFSKIEVNVGDVTGTSNRVFGYRAPLVTGIDPPMAPIYGDATVIISGKFLGRKGHNSSMPTGIIGGRGV